MGVGDIWEPLASRECPAESHGGLDWAGHGEEVMDLLRFERQWTELICNMASPAIMELISSWRETLE